MSGVAAAAVCVWLIGDPTGSAGPGTGWFPSVFANLQPAAGTAKTAESSADADAKSQQQRQLLGQVIVRDADSEKRIDRAFAAIESGDVVEGLRYLQRWLSEGEDVFVWPDDQSTPESARAAAVRRLGASGGDVLQTYDQLFGVEAAALLAEAQRSSDPAKFAEVSRRYYFTRAGFQAVDWLATRAMDRGQFRLATRFWDRLLNEPAHQRFHSRGLLLKAALASRLNGDDSRAAELMAEIGTERIQVGGRQVLAREWLNQSHRVISSIEPGLSWPVYAGGPQRGHRSVGSTPLLSPLWHTDYAHDENNPVVNELQRWQQQQLGHVGPLSVANSPVVSDGMLFLRDFSHLRAIDLSTGTQQWRYRCQTSPRSALEATRSGRRLSPTSGALNLGYAYAGNATWGSLSTDGQTVFLVDGLDFTSPNPASQRRATPPPKTPFDPRISRRANRLVAIPAHPDLSNGATTVEPRWVVGGARISVEDYQLMDRDHDGRIAAGEFIGPEDDFQAMDADRDGSINRNELQLSVRRMEAERRLPGHFFFGAPLPAEGRLYAISEADRQLNLVVLDAETGDLIWTQGLGFVDRPIEQEPVRPYFGCQPALASGIVVCPTHLGALVAVDALTGSLLWANYNGETSSLPSRRNWQRRTLSARGHSGFPAVPLIDQNRVVMLPRHSTSIQCVDLLNGESLWSAPRDDAEFVGTVHDGVVVVVGRRNCRGLSLANGQEVWSLRSTMPSGTGVAVGDRYLLPLQEGRVMSIDIQSGTEIGVSVAHRVLRSRAGPGRSDDVAASGAAATGEKSPALSPDWFPGNLVAINDTVLSANAFGITAFPQAAVRMQEVLAELQQTPDSRSAHLLAAELELLQGHLQPARQHLKLLADVPQNAPERIRADAMMRELLYRDLEQSNGDDEAILSQLDKLSRSPEDRGRYLIRLAERKLDQGDVRAVLASTQEFAQLALDEPLPMAGHSGHLVTAASWVPSMLGRVRQQVGPAELDRIRLQIDEAMQQALQTGTREALDRFLSVYSQWPQAEAVRAELARQLISEGQFQHGELLLLENRRSGNQHTRAVATAELARLWDHMNLPAEAASMLESLQQDFADVRLDGGTTGAEFARDAARDPLTALAVRRRQPLDYPVHRVEIREQRWIGADPHLEQTFSRYRRRFLTPSDNSYMLLDKGSSSQGEMAIIDRQTGIVVGKVEIPSRNSYPSLTRSAHVGHFVPLGGPASMNGLSLLEHWRDKPLWTDIPPELAQREEILRVGPAGPGFCCFQARQHLIVVEPATGRTLWRRTDLEPSSGLISDTYAGMFGDEEAIVVFDSDRSTYTVYRTSTGEEIRRGKLQLDVRKIRRVFGRYLFHVTTIGLAQRMRIWDPLEDRMLFDAPVEGRLYSAITSDNELVVISPPDRLQILDVETGRLKVTIKLEPGEINNLNYIRAFREDRTWYINLQRNQHRARSQKYHYYASDSFLEADHIQGELIAVDAETSEIRWKRTIPQRTIIRTPHCRLPFLIGMSRVRDRSNGNRQSLLIEAFDVNTGRTLAVKDNIFPDRMVNMVYDPDRQTLDLQGLKTRVTLSFSKRQQQLWQDGDGLQGFSARDRSELEPATNRLE